MTQLHEEFLRQLGEVERAQQTARVVVFNLLGYRKAKHEDYVVMGNFMREQSVGGLTYCGLPYIIDKSQSEEIVVTHEHLFSVEQRIKGTRAEPRQNAITVRLSFDKSAMQCLLDGTPIGEPITTAQIVASSLTADQLCDIIMAWLGNDPDWGDFEKALKKVVDEHGSFE